MFSLTKHRCILTNVNPRAEKHGEENVIAVDVNLRTDIAAAALDQLAPGIVGLLYKPAAKTQGELIAGTIAPDELRFDGALDTLRFRKDLSGYSATITWGDLASSISVELSDCRVHKFNADPMPGGSCQLALQIQARPSNSVMGQLCGLIQHEVSLTLTPPQADDQP